MNRLTRTAPAFLTALAVLAVPALAQAKPGKGTVLQVNRAHHRVELVDARHVVHNYLFSGRTGRKLRHGAEVTYRAQGKRLTGLKVVGRARKVAFYASVVSTGQRGLVLKLADGRRVKIGKPARRRTRHARAAGSVQINVQGLKPGQTVLITETDDGNGNLSITIKLFHGADGGDASGGEDQDAVGTVTAVAEDGSSLTIDADGQGTMTFQTDPDLVDGVEVGDEVDVTYYQDTDGTLVADDVEPADDSSDVEDQDAVGTVTAIADDGSSITVDVDGQGAQTFTTDPDLVDGVSVGDEVDVSYFQGDDGTLVADDVEPVDDSSGDDPGADDGSSDSSDF